MMSMVIPLRGVVLQGGTLRDRQPVLSLHVDRSMGR
jgi:hypothetical protein